MSELTTRKERDYRRDHEQASNRCSTCKCGFTGDSRRSVCRHCRNKSIVIDPTVQADRDRMKWLVMEAAVDYCNLLDCVEEPLGLDYKTTKDGVKIRIDAGLVEG